MSTQKQSDLRGALMGGVGGAGLGGVTGAGLGGLYGLASGAFESRKGHRLRDSLRGMGRGMLGGGLLGAGAGAGLGAGIGGLLPVNKVLAAAERGTPLSQDEIAAEINKINPRLASKLMTASAITGSALGGTLAGNALTPAEEEVKQKTEDTKMAASKQSALNDYVTSPTAQGALMGGAGSALAGGLAGLLAPGHEDTVDEYGNPIRKQRNRFGAALRGALGAGALGAAGGAAAGHFAPGPTTSAFNAAGQYGSQAMDQLKNFGSGMARQLGFGGKQLPAYQPATPYKPDTQFNTQTRQPITPGDPAMSFRSTIPGT